MNAPTITFRQFGSTPSLTDLIQELTAKLEALAPRATHCEVLVEAPTKHHRHGATFAARVDLSIPGAVVIGHARDEDAHVAVKRAFAAARKRVVEMIEKRRRAA